MQIIRLAATIGLQAPAFITIGKNYWEFDDIVVEYNRIKKSGDIIELIDFEAVYRGGTSKKLCRAVVDLRVRGGTLLTGGYGIWDDKGTLLSHSEAIPTEEFLVAFKRDKEAALRAAKSKVLREREGGKLSTKKRV